MNPQLSYNQLKVTPRIRLIATHRDVGERDIEVLHCTVSHMYGVGNFNLPSIYYIYYYNVQVGD